MVGAGSGVGVGGRRQAGAVVAGGGEYGVLVG